MAKVDIHITAKDDASGRISDVGDEIDELGKGTVNTMANMVTALNQTAQAMSALGSGVTEGAAQMTGSFASFDQAMYNTQSVLGASQDEFEELRKLALKLGEDLPVSAQEAAEGFYTLASSGWDVADVMEHTDAIMKAAVAGNTDFATAAGITTATLGAFQDQGYEVNDVLDILMQTVKKGRTTFAELAETMPYLGSAAASAGISLEDVGASIDQVRNAGVPASMAGTSLAQAISALAKPSEEAADLMSQYGIVMYENAEGGLDFVKTMAEMSTSLSDLEPGLERAAVLEEIFGKRGMKAAAAMLENTDVLIANREAMYESGVAVETYETQMEGAGNQLRILEGRLENARMKIGEQLLPAQLAVNEATVWFYEGLSSLHPELVKYGGAVLIIAGNVMTALAPIMQMIASITTLVMLKKLAAAAEGKHGGSIVFSTASMYAHAAAAKVAAAATWLYNAALAANPIVLITMAIVGAIAVMYAWNEVAGMASDAAGDTDRSLRSMVDAMTDAERATYDGTGTMEEYIISISEGEASIDALNMALEDLDAVMLDTSQEMDAIRIAIKEIEMEALARQTEEAVAAYDELTNQILAADDAISDKSREMTENEIRLRELRHKERYGDIELTEAEKLEMEELEKANSLLRIEMSKQRLERENLADAQKESKEAMEAEVALTEEEQEEYDALNQKLADLGLAYDKAALDHSIQQEALERETKLVNDLTTAYNDLIHIKATYGTTVYGAQVGPTQGELISAQIALALAEEAYESREYGGMIEREGLYHLHEDEAVIPADIVRGLQSSVSSGAAPVGGGGGTTNNYNYDQRRLSPRVTVQYYGGGLEDPVHGRRLGEAIERKLMMLKGWQ